MTISPRVQTLLGEKAVAEVPLVMSFPTAQATAEASSVPAETSEKWTLFEAAGDPAAFQR